MADYDIEITVPTRGPRGPQGTPGEQTTDASLLTSGTLNDARLSANVLLQAAADARYGPTLFAYKAANTPRNSTTTLAADPDLALANVPVGVYEVALSLQVYDNSNHGFLWDIAGTATMSSLGRALLLPDLGSGNLGISAISNGILSGQSIAPWANATQTARYIGLISVTVAGSIEFRWAQQTSNANNLAVFAGSRMTLQKFP
jgi:hypothetical protein